MVGGCSFYYAIYSNNFLWVSRSGSIITVLGILLTIKHKIFLDSLYVHALVANPSFYNNHLPFEKKDDNQNKDLSLHLRQTKERLRDEYIGFALTIIGTIIWGYGDLLGVFYA